MSAADATALPHGIYSHSVERVTLDGRPVIRKTAPRGGDQRAVTFAEREAIVLQSALLDRYRVAGLPPPELLRVEASDAAVTMYLADVGSQHLSTVDEAVEVARRAGLAQGGYLSELPDEPWLCGDFLADYAVAAHDVTQIEDVLRDDAAWALAAPLLPMRAEFAELWDDRHNLLDRLAGTAHSLLHNDFWPANLMATGPERFVLLDWAFCGLGPLGADAANLVVDSIFDGYLPVSQLPALEAQVWPAYLQGLRQSGADFDHEAVRFGYLAAGAVKYGWLGPRTVQRVREGALRSYAERQSAEDALLARAAGLRLVLDWAAELRGR